MVYNIFTLYVSCTGITDSTHFLYKTPPSCVSFRDLKLENLMISGDVLKIVDFGEAIKLQGNMKLPYEYRKINNH